MDPAFRPAGGGKWMQACATRIVIFLQTKRDFLRSGMFTVQHDGKLSFQRASLLRAHTLINKFKP